ncbi:Extracellular metalloproteinase mep [Lachnellula cervina]|uniref:Extracellular metalloproteinase n=1 Tax=Lachnellula cervina TaxID=1316786 RepID=A0A7D8YXX1_9HELO|nr:Extracellular metalloproteinase mep [Lachnellula cervina]
MRVIAAASAAAFLASQAFGHPTSTTPRRSLSRRVVDLNAFRLDTVADYKNSTSTAKSITAPPLFKREDYVDAATAHVKSIAPGKEFRLVDDHYIGSNGIAHVNFKQTVHELDIDNADFNVNIAKDGSVFSYGNSFYSGATPSENPMVKRDQVDPIAALTGVSNVLALPITASDATAKPEASAAEHYVIEGTTGAYQDPKARLVYFQNPDNTLSLTWRVETDLNDDWLLSYVDADSASKILGVVNYVADVSYRVYPWGINDPSKGDRILETDPWDTKASEFTWQSDGSTTYSVTRGNNGIAQANYEGDDAYLNDYRPTASNSSFDFDFSLDWTNFKTYSNSSVTQIFYTANMYHDLLYDLGFTEAAGNFETDNDGLGGVGSDAVILNSQDGSGTNNANFATPPDGQAGRMRMFMWTTATPNRDCAFDAGVIIHEYTHGVSNRLTGGPSNVNCLNVLEAGGMGEGWGDAMAIVIHTKTNDTRATDYPMGDWVDNDPAGIRSYLYSTSLTTNPLTYESLNSLNEVHAIGTAWATIIYEILWNLVDKHGITSDRRPTFDDNGVPTDGRFLTMKLVIDGMALQPCSPTFISARDAIIDADQALTGGDNVCELWTAFAKRGVGSGASRGTSTGRTESYDLPSGVC